MPGGSDSRQPSSPRPVCAILSLLTLPLDACGWLGSILAHYNPAGGLDSVAQVTPGVEFGIVVAIIGVILAIVSLMRGEGASIPIAALAIAGLLLWWQASWWLENARSSPVRKQREARERETSAERDRQRQLDHKNLRLRLTYRTYGPRSWLKLTQDTTEHQDFFDSDVNVGVAGSMGGPAFPKGAMAHVTWPEPRTFELKLQIDSEDVSLKFKVENLPGCTATLDGEPIALPLDLPAGKRQVTVCGKCP